MEASTNECTSHRLPTYPVQDRGMYSSYLYHHVHMILMIHTTLPLLRPAHFLFPSSH